MTVSALNHFTLRCSPESLPRVLEFYTKHIGLVPGSRPVMSFPGYWLYSGGQPIVHLAAFLDDDQGVDTGALDHISFRAHGLDETRERLEAQGVPFEEAPVPGWPLYQVFIKDPNGLKIELTFDLNEEKTAAGNGPAS